MTTKCTCNNCSTHLEFDSADAGTVISCPQCGMDTKLYVPQTTTTRSNEKPAKAPSAPANPYAAELAGIRAATCYKTLRTVIDVTFTVCKALAILSAILKSVSSLFISEPGIGAGLKILMAIGFLLAGALVTGLLHAGHQAALLLVDIADCQVRVVTRQTQGRN